MPRKRTNIPKNYNAPLPSKLRHLMDASGHTQADLASHLGVTRQSVSAYMDGSANPNPTTIVSIAKFLDVSTDYLLGNTEYQNDMTICDRIKSLCVENGLTIKTLEKELGFGNGVIRRWNESSPSINAVIRVADYFNVSVDWLCGLSDAKSKDCKIAAACNYIGLDEDEIAILRNLKQTPYRHEVISHILRIVKIIGGI